MLFKREKKAERLEEKSFDREKQIPVLRCSICNGEQVAGFKHLHTGAFREEMLIQNDRELAAFKSRYGIDEIEKEY